MFYGQFKGTQNFRHGIVSKRICLELQFLCVSAACQYSVLVTLPSAMSARKKVIKRTVSKEAITLLSTSSSELIFEELRTPDKLVHHIILSHLNS